MTEKEVFSKAIQRVIENCKQSSSSRYFFREDKEMIQTMEQTSYGSLIYNTFFFDEEGYLIEIL